MKLEKIDIAATVTETVKLLEEDQLISTALKTSIQALLFIVQLLIERLGVNSSNSSVPPSRDPNRKKKDKKKSDKKPGGQRGHQAELGYWIGKLLEARVLYRGRESSFQLCVY